MWKSWIMSLPLTNKILIWVSGPHRFPVLLLKKGYIWGTVCQGVWSQYTQEHWSLPAWWNQECPVPATAPGNWSSPFWSSWSTAGGLLSAHNYACEHVFSGSRVSLLATGHSSLFLVLLKTMILLKELSGTCCTRHLQLPEPRHSPIWGKTLVCTSHVPVPTQVRRQLELFWQVPSMAETTMPQSTPFSE